MVQTGSWFWSHLTPLLPRQEQVGSALVPVRCGPVPQKLDLELTDQTGLEAELLHFRIKASHVKKIFFNRFIINLMVNKSVVCFMIYYDSALIIFITLFLM